MSFLKKLFNHTHTYKEDTNMTNKDKALALINTFATGDTDVAKKNYWLKDIFSTTQELLMGFPDSEQLLKLLANRAFR